MIQEEKPILIKLIDFLNEEIKDKTKEQRILNYYLEVSNKLFDARDVIISLLNIYARLNKELPDPWNEAKKEHLAYELDNFYLRIYMFHQRMIQLINCVYLKLEPSSNHLSYEIKKNKRTTEVAKILHNFEQVNAEALKTRRLLTHQSYEHYPPLPFFLVLGRDEISKKQDEERIYEEITKRKVKETKITLGKSVEFFENSLRIILNDLNNNFDNITRIY